MGFCVDTLNGAAEIAPGHEADYFYVGLTGPFRLDVLSAEVQLEGRMRSTVAHKVKEFIVRGSWASGAIAIDKKLMKVRAGSVGSPGCTGGLRPTGDNPAAANDWVLTVCCFPDGVAVLWTKYQGFRKKICSRVNRDRDGASYAG